MKQGKTNFSTTSTLLCSGEAKLGQNRRNQSQNQVTSGAPKASDPEEC